MVSNDTMSVVSKSNKCETYQQKITTQLTNEKHALMRSYFYKHVSHLLGFNTDGVASFDTKFFFLKMSQINFNLVMYVYTLCVLKFHMIL